MLAVVVGCGGVCQASVCAEKCLVRSLGWISCAARPPAFHTALGIPRSARCPGQLLLGFANAAMLLHLLVALLLEVCVCVFELGESCVFHQVTGLS